MNFERGNRGLPLFDHAASEILDANRKELTIAERWADFHHANPQVFEAIHRIADDQRRGGRRRISVNRIFEDLRADPRLWTGDKPYKLNNSYRAFYARELIRRYPVFEGLIEIRGRDQK